MGGCGSSSAKQKKDSLVQEEREEQEENAKKKTNHQGTNGKENEKESTRSQRIYRTPSFTGIISGEAKERMNQLLGCNKWYYPNLQLIPPQIDGLGSKWYPVLLHWTRNKNHKDYRMRRDALPVGIEIYTHEQKSILYTNEEIVKMIVTETLSRTDLGYSVPVFQTFLDPKEVWDAIALLDPSALQVVPLIEEKQKKKNEEKEDEHQNQMEKEEEKEKEKEKEKEEEKEKENEEIKKRIALKRQARGHKREASRIDSRLAVELDFYTEEQKLEEQEKAAKQVQTRLIAFIHESSWIQLSFDGEECMLHPQECMRAKFRQFSEHYSLMAELVHRIGKQQSRIFNWVLNITLTEN